MLYVHSPSISDKTRAGYFSQDCASQTEKSDLVNLKEVTNMVGILVEVKLQCIKTVCHLFNINHMEYGFYIRFHFNPPDVQVTVYV